MAKSYGGPSVHLISHKRNNKFWAFVDNLEEVFENREQIEISRHYEKLPKPVAISILEFQEGGTYYRYPEVVIEK